MRVDWHCSSGSRAPSAYAGVLGSRAFLWGVSHSCSPHFSSLAPSFSAFKVVSSTLPSFCVPLVTPNKTRARIRQLPFSCKKIISQGECWVFHSRPKSYIQDIEEAWMLVLAGSSLGPTNASTDKCCLFTRIWLVGTATLHLEMKSKNIKNTRIKSEDQDWDPALSKRSE